MNIPLISVIIPLYNKEKAIECTLKSVLNQSLNDFEVVIVDDGSTDNSSYIVRNIAKIDKRVKYYYKENGGVSSARNLGLSKSNGIYVVWLDADDEMLPDNLEILYKLICNYGTDIASANIKIRDKKGCINQVCLRISKATVFDNFILAMISHKASFCTGATIFKKQIIPLNPYNTNLSRYEDAEFELEILYGRKIVMSPIPVMIHNEEYAGLSLIRNNNRQHDFIFNMKFGDKHFWQKVKMGQLLIEGKRTYDKSESDLKHIYGRNYYYSYIFIVIKKIIGAQWKIRKCLDQMYNMVSV